MPKRQIKRAETVLESERDEEILYLQDYALAYYDKEWVQDFKYSCNLGLYPENAWNFLVDPLNMNTEEKLNLYKGVEYYCPFSNNIYLGAYPVGYLSSKKPTLSASLSSNTWAHFILDNLQNSKQTERELTHIGSIGRALMGHGYALKTLNMGSDPRLTDVVTKINKTEYLIFKVWKQRLT